NSFRIETGTVSALAFSPGGRLLAVAEEGGTIGLWDPVDGSMKTAISAHQGKVSALSFHPAGRRLASAGPDGVVKLWDLESGREIKEFRGHTYGVTALAFAPGGNVFASASHDDTVRLYAEIPVRDTAAAKAEKQEKDFPRERIVRTAGVLDESEPGYCQECGERLVFFARLLGRRYCGQHKK
ncbi:MAG TPA: hypothetical protein VJC03_04375, partial [bacterium]|nr:hypothetical protein [bacterium]